MTLSFDLLTQKSIAVLLRSRSIHLWSIIIVCQKKMVLWCGNGKSKFDLWPFDQKSTDILLRSRSTYMWSIIIACQMEEELLYRNHFFTDGQTDSYGETSIPPQLRWRRYTSLFSMWRNRWKMTPLEVKISWGESLFNDLWFKI